MQSVAEEQLEKEELRAGRLAHGRFSPVRVTLRGESDSAEVIKRSEELAKELNYSRVASLILASRGIQNAEEARAYLQPTLRDHLPDPTQIKNIGAAVTLLLDAVEKQEKIIVFHDFDVDGLTAGSQLALFLKGLGAKVQAYVPNRFTEGYGLTMTALDNVFERGCDVLVTVDCGISNVAEIAYAKAKKVKTLILDHHEPSELPKADVIVDPAQEGCPFQEYRVAAAGLVWLTLIALRKEAKVRFPDKNIPNPKEFLDLAALGTICDMVPLHSLNRLIAYRGIEALKTTKRVGMLALMEVAGLRGKPRFGAGHISFGLGPRINAAGRLDSAEIVGDLLTTDDSKRAKKLATSLDKLNTQRRSVEEQVRDNCIRSLARSERGFARHAFAIHDPEFHLGVIGIAAQRIVEEFHRPAAVMGDGEAVVEGRTVRVCKGSVRSIKGFHVSEVLHGMSDILLNGGGHAAAGGFSLLPENLDAFCERFEQAAVDILSEEQLQRCCNIDVFASLLEVDFILAEQLQNLAPFGIGNPSPVLATEKVVVNSVTPLSGKHLKLRFSDGVCSRTAIAWNMLGHPLLVKDAVVNIAYQVEINSYKGVASVQLSLKDVWG